MMFNYPLLMFFSQNKKIRGTKAHMASAAARALVPESLLSCGSSSTKRSNVSEAQNHMVYGSWLVVYLPLWKILVSWGYYSQWKNKNVPNHQPGRVSGHFDGKLWFLTSIFCFEHFRDVVSHHFHDLKWLKLSHVMGIVGIQWEMT